MDLLEAVNKIRSVGRDNVRIQPKDPAKPIDGPQEVQIRQNGNWTTVTVAANRKIAESVVSQAINRVILG